MVAPTLARGFGSALAAGVLGVTSAAHAVPAHWDVMVERYGWGGDCTLCHESAAGGDSTATRPFALSLKTLGLNARTTRDDLLGIMYVSEVLATDSDGDLYSDVQELRYAGDPNDPEVGLGELDTGEGDSADEGDDGDADPNADAPTACAWNAERPSASRASWLWSLWLIALLLTRRYRRTCEGLSTEGRL